MDPSTTRGEAERQSSVTIFFTPTCGPTPTNPACLPVRESPSPYPAAPSAPPETARTSFGAACRGCPSTSNPWPRHHRRHLSNPPRTGDRRSGQEMGGGRGRGGDANALIRLPRQQPRMMPPAANYALALHARSGLLLDGSRRVCPCVPLPLCASLALVGCAGGGGDDEDIDMGGDYL
jgi:hypothetical protein